jgi:hypothetical protein
MGIIGVAFRAFWVALVDRDRAERIRAALDGQTLPKINIDVKSQRPEATPKLADTPPKRSEAITLLAALQREARLVDLVRQPLDQFTDEQIGGAARNVLKDAAGVLDRFFAIRTVAVQEEGTTIELPMGYDPARYKLTGRAEGSGPFRGTLAHQGWQATKCTLPAWTGSAESGLVIAPAEVEV